MGLPPISIRSIDDGRARVRARHSSRSTGTGCSALSPLTTFRRNSLLPPPHQASRSPFVSHCTHSGVSGHPVVRLVALRACPRSVHRVHSRVVAPLYSVRHPFFQFSLCYVRTIYAHFSRPLVNNASKSTIVGGPYVRVAFLRGYYVSVVEPFYYSPPPVVFQWC